MGESNRNSRFKELGDELTMQINKYSQTLIVLDKLQSESNTKFDYLLYENVRNFDSNQSIISETNKTINDYGIIIN